MTGQRGSSRCRARRSGRGFTIVELLVTIAVIGLLAGLAGTNYFRYVEKARIARSVAEIEAITRVIDAITSDDDEPTPDSLSELDIQTPNDPWGTPYQYLRIEGVFDISALAPAVAPLPSVSAKGGVRPMPTKPRKDRFLKPINTDYDLYSAGPDGISRESLTHHESRDDVVRAINGVYVGLAELF